MKKEIKILLDVAAQNLYDSLHQGEFGGVLFQDLPPEDKEVWNQAASKWIMNFLNASHKLSSQDIATYLKQFILDNEFPLDDTTQLKVIRSELLLKELEIFENKINI